VFTGPLEYVGTFDLATGVLTPPAPGGSLGATPGTIYNNSCFPNNPNVFYYNLGTGDAWLDDGRLPSTSSPAPAVGTLNAYHLTSVVMGYVTSEMDPTLGGPGARVDIKLWQDYDNCTSLANAGTPTAAYTGAGMPGSLNGLPRAILITLNIPPAIQTTLIADANGVYDANETLDGFGYGFQAPVQTAGATTGIICAGAPPPNPNACTIGDGTYYQNPGAGISGTGLDDDGFWNLTTPAGATCYLNPNSSSTVAYGGFYLQLIADLDDCNGNALPDVDDITSGFSLDANLDGIPDECQQNPIVNYCTAGTSLNGCIPAITATGTPSVSTASGFIVSVSAVEGQKQGIIFYGTSIPIAAPWGTSNSFLCVKAPTQRTGVQSSGGVVNQCNGSLSLDLFAYLSAHPTALGNPFSAGQKAFFQGWYRDQGSPKTTSLSDGLQVTFQP
jgi:hypothetical protein